MCNSRAAGRTMAAWRRSPCPGVGRGRCRERGGDRGLERGPVRSLRRVPRPDRRRPEGARRRRDAALSARARGTACSTSAAASATRPSSSPPWSAPEGQAVGRGRLRAVHRGLDRGGARGRGGERRLLRGRRPGRRPAGPIRLRVLADGGDVLRQPGAGAAQHPRLASPRGPAGRAPSGGASSTTSGFTAPSRRPSSTWRSPRSPRTCAVVPARSRWRTPTPSPSSSRSPGSSGRPSPAATSRSRSANDLDHAVAFNMALGPAAELLRICPADEVDRLRPKVEREIREASPTTSRPTAWSWHRPRPGSSPRPSPSSHGSRREPSARLRLGHGRADPEGGNLRAPRRDPGAVEAALGLPLTRRG